MASQANYLRVRLESLEDGNGQTVWRAETDKPRNSADDEPAGDAAAPIPCAVQAPPCHMLLCTTRGLLRKMQKRAMVGDRVHVTAIDWPSCRATVDDIMERTSVLTEPRVANVSHLVVVFAVAAPLFDPGPATRYLVAGEAAGLAVTVVLNKADLVDSAKGTALAEEVGSWGYDVILASTVTGEGMADIAAALEGRTSVLAGPSGAGKSSIINALADMSRRGGGARSRAAWPETATPVGIQHDAPRGNEDPAGDDVQTCDDEAAFHDNKADANHGDDWKSQTESGGQAIPPMQAVGEVSPRIGRGRHTTRNVTLLGLGTGAVADTPGFNQPSLAGLDPRRVAACFPEAAARAGGCAFADCAHVHEPGCAVRDAGWTRYSLYTELLEERRVATQVEMRRGELRRAREGTTRAKDRAGGRVVLEAKLENKKHRRESRRATHQGLQNLVRQELD